MFGIADNTNPCSWASGFRRRRVRCFCDLLHIDETTHILDVGGTVEFWQNAGMRGNITILNTGCESTVSSGGGFHYIQGDACDLSQFNDYEFDVVFSNSVVEHVGSWEDQMAMASEIRRVGRNYFIQVPNHNFPIEPHFLFPAFQFLPALVRRSIAKHWPYGWYEPGSSQALHDADCIRMLNCSELSELFPDAFILGESFLCFTKSLVAVHPRNDVTACPGFKILRHPKAIIGGNRRERH